MKEQRISSGILAGVAICLLLILNPDLGAQTSRVNGNLLGTVIDSTGAVIPGATVQVRNLSTGLSRTQESDANGQFKIRELPSGTYHVTVTHDGFSTYDNPNISISLGSVSNLTVQLSAGAVAQQLT